MRWTREAIEIYIEYYYQLKGYELKPWQEKFTYRGETAIRGKGGRFRAPFETQAILNAEFDLSIKVLGKLGSLVFRLRYLDGYGLEEINKMLKEPYKDIAKSYYSVKRKLINYLLESEKE